VDDRPSHLTSGEAFGVAATCQTARRRRSASTCRRRCWCAPTRWLN